MKIRSIKSRKEDLGLTRPYTIAYGHKDFVSNIVLDIELKNGIRGMGIAAPLPSVTGESDEACLRALAPAALDWLVGADIRLLAEHCREIQASMPETPAARAALEIALHDALARMQKLPLVDMLGRIHQSLSTSITIGIKPIPEALLEAQEYVDRGFSILKVMLGHWVERDVELLHKLREKYSSDILIRVDPSQGYNLDELREFMEQTESLEVEFIEQPLAANAQADEELLSLPEEMRGRIALDESLQTEEDALALLRPENHCGIFNMKLMKCGGITAAKRISALADTAGIRLMWGCTDESRVSIAAALHTALSCPNTSYLDLDGFLDLERDLVTGGVMLEDGVLSTLNLPGLGIEPL